jgi:hypothetical protein
MGAVCKTVAKASKVRILHPPHARRTAPDLHVRVRGRVVGDLTGSHRYPHDLVCRLSGRVVRFQRGLDPESGRFLLTVDALGADLHEHVDAVPDPLGYLRRRYARGDVAELLGLVEVSTRKSCEYVGMAIAGVAGWCGRAVVMW